MERWLVKFVVLIIIFVVVFGMTILPIWVEGHFHRQGERGVRIISYLMCFGGGVFLAMYMLQMAPDASAILQTHVVEPYIINYPLPEFIIACGFLLMLLSENFVNEIGKSSASKKKNKNDKNGRTGNPFNREQENAMDNKLSQVKTSNPCLYKKLALSRELLYSDEGLPEIRVSDVVTDDEDNDTVFNDDSECESTGNDYYRKRRQSGSLRKESGVCFSTDTDTPLLSIPSPDLCNLKIHEGIPKIPESIPKMDEGIPKLHEGIPKIHENIPKIPSYTFQPLSPPGNDGFQLQTFTSLAFTSTPGLAPILNVGISYGLAPLMHIGKKRKVKFTDMCSKSEASHKHDHSVEESSSHTGGPHVHATRSLILLFALSLHHVFEGLSIGLKDTSSSVWGMCLAIVSHEVIIAFSLGMQLMGTFKKVRKVVLSAFICSVMSPVGISIGMAILETGGEESHTVQIINGVLQALATGIFIYVTFFEILQGELSEDRASFTKVAWVIVGFLVLSSFGLIPQENAEDENVSYMNITMKYLADINRTNCNCTTDV